MGRDGKFFRLFRRSPAIKKNPPADFICPISKSLMFDPYAVSSGQSFEGLSVRVCRELGFTPTLAEGSTPDFSSMVPNTVLKNRIHEWCSGNGLELPKQPTDAEVNFVVRSLMENRENPSLPASERDLIEGMAETPGVLFSHADTECIVGKFDRSSSSEESVVANNSSSTLPFATRPSCLSYCSSPSSFSGNVPNEISSNVFSESSEEEYFVSRMESLDIYEQEQAVILLRKTTKSSLEARTALCSNKLLRAMRELLGSRYAAVQINALASLVNLSLEKGNKVKILRNWIVPSLIDVLKSGSDEAREHAAGAIFSLAMEDGNRTPIGVLGAIEPLIHELRSGTARSRHDSALALYHLTLDRSNRTRIVQLAGATGVLLGLLNDRDVASRVAFVLCNLAASDAGKASLFNNKAVECLVDVLRGWREKHSELTLENCAAALQLLSDGSSKFNSVAMSCGALEVLDVVAESGSKRAKEKAKRILEVLRRVATAEDATEVDWNAMMKNSVSRPAYRASQLHNAHSTAF